MSTALCYDKTNDKLYIGHSTGINVLLESHEEKGHKHNRPPFLIPETTFRIKIESNFGYGNASYLRASVWDNDIPLLNFNNWWNSVDYNCKLPYFNVEPTPQNWRELFNQIIEVYKQKDSWNYNGIYTGLNDLNNALSHPEEIAMRKNPWQTPQNTYDEKTILRHLARKTNELLKELKSLKLENAQFCKDILNSILTKLIPLTITEYKRLFQEHQNNSTPNQDVIASKLNQFDEYFDTLYNYLKHTSQLYLFFTKL